MRERLFNRNFTFLILGQACSLAGNYTLKFALSMYVLERTGSAAVFAGLLASAMVPTILLSPFGGILADRVDRKKIMVCLDALSGVVILAAAFLLSTGNDIAVIGVLLLALSVLGAFESPTVQACVPQMQTGDNVVKGNAVVNQVAAVAALVTPFLGSAFYTAFGIHAVLYAAVLCFFLTALLECFIRLEWKKRSEKQRIREVVREDVGVSMRFLFREEPGIAKLLLLAALVSLFAVGTMTVGFPYLVRTVLGLSAEHYGAAESALGASAILGSLAVGLLADRWRMGKMYLPLLAFGLCLLPAGGVFLLSWSPLGKYVVLVLAFCGGQAACTIFSVFALSAIQGRTPLHLMGKVMAYVSVLSMCAQPLGQMIYGLLFDALADRVCWVLLSAGGLVCAIALLAVPFFKRLEGEQD